MKRNRYTVYEDLVTEAVMRVAEDRYRNGTSKPLITEGFGGGWMGILALLLALFGIPLFTNRSSSSSSGGTTTTTDNSTTQTGQQGTTQQQSTQQQTPPSNTNNENLEALAKKLKLVDVMEKLSGRNIKYEPQYAKPLAQYGNKVFYAQPPKAYLTSTFVEKLNSVLKELEKRKFGLLIYDATRPPSLQTELLDAAKQVDGANYTDGYIAASGNSLHNKGKALDCTLYDMQTNQPIDMGGEFDERSKKSSTNYYKNRNKTYHGRRMILKNAMSKYGIKNYSEEWWHYTI